MVMLSISGAARAAGKDRGTIKRYINSGKLSCSKDAAGNPQIDTAELLRVFGTLASGGDAAGDAAEPQYAPADTAAIELLRQQLQAAQEREQWFKGQLEAAQARIVEMENRMLPPGQSEKKSFWRKLIGG